MPHAWAWGESHAGLPNIVLAATHAPRIDEARARLDVPAVREVLVTDSVPQELAWPKLRVVSVAPLLVSAIRHIALLHEPVAVSS